LSAGSKASNQSPDRPQPDTIPTPPAKQHCPQGAAAYGRNSTENAITIQPVALISNDDCNAKWSFEYFDLTVSIGPFANSNSIPLNDPQIAD